MKRFKTLNINDKEKAAYIYRETESTVYYVNMQTGKKARANKDDIQAEKSLKGYSLKRKLAVKKMIKAENAVQKLIKAEAEIEKQIEEAMQGKGSKRKQRKAGRKTFTKKEKAIATAIVIALLILSI